MDTILLLPLDERPCNTIYPKMLFNHEDLKVIQPDPSILGQKKTPANLKALDAFLMTHAKEAQGLVLSLDMLLYGGIVPSRLHHQDEAHLIERYQVIHDIKAKYPKLMIYAFDLVMRCPQYSSDDEEPTYYKYCGKEIFQKGFYSHKQALGIASDEEMARLDSIVVPEDDLNDYLGRRKHNLAMNLHTLNLVESGLIDFLVIPQDDAAEYGWTAMDQTVIKASIKEKRISEKVMMYPGADEVANTLLSRMVTNLKESHPTFHVHYPTEASRKAIPLLEDLPLEVTVQYQIEAAGGKIVRDDQPSDIELFVHAADRMLPNAYIHALRPEVKQDHITPFVERINQAINLGQRVAIADVFALNGSDYRLMDQLNEQNLLIHLSSYAGWNTSSNTLGTTIPFAIQTKLYGMTDTYKDFLMSRYVEDYAYMAYARTAVSDRLKERGLSYQNIKPDLPWVTSTIQETMQVFIQDRLSSIKDHIVIHSVWMPWQRMFEIGVDVTFKP